MWSKPTSAWKPWFPDFVGDEIDPDRSTGPLSGHRDFAYDLLRWRQPEVVVELGTHYGVSFFSFCQAIRDAGAETALHAIDTWEGDDHAGFYGEEVFDQFRKSADRFEGVNMKLHRSTFDDALSDFDDESIDLLHIDGLHTYEALSHDFETWLPKLSTGGVVLLHDVSLASGYGSARYYKETVETSFPGFSFEHNFGLGVVFPKGIDGWEFLLTEDFQHWKVTYAQASAVRELKHVEADQSSMIMDRDDAIRAQGLMIDERDEAIRAQGSMIDERERLIARYERSIERKDVELENRDHALKSNSRQLRQARDRISKLAPLETSPKAQLKALRHSLPQSLRKRAREARVKRVKASRNDSDTNEKAPSSVGLKAVKSTRVSLSTLVESVAGERFQTDRESIDQLLFSGRPLSPAHANALVDQLSDGAREMPRASRMVLHRDRGQTDGTLDQLVAAVDVDLVSIDVWDTLIDRNRPADAAKTATARRILLSQNQVPGVAGLGVFEITSLRVQVESQLSAADPSGEYELRDVIDAVLERLGCESETARSRLSLALAAEEVNDEIKWSIPRDEVVALWRNVEGPSVLISDFYMTSEQLSKVVRDVTGVDAELHVSVDSGSSKRVGGQLFDQVRLEKGVVPERHLHIGDNEISDVERQVEKGGLSILVPRDGSHPPPGAFTASNLESCWAELDRQLASLSDDSTDQYRKAGQELAPFAVVLVASAIEEAHRSGVDRVHYLSREGSFLRAIHQKVEPILSPGHLESVQGVHLEVSRRSTFGASLEVPLRDSFHRMWSMYSRQTVAAMLTSIGMVPEEQLTHLDAVGLRPETMLSDASNDPRVAELLESPGFIMEVTSHVDRSRDLLRDYVQGRTTITDPFVLVDIGWRGTIQDNLVRALEIEHSTGVYFGLFPFLNAQPAGSRKIGVAFDGNRGEEFNFAEPPAVLERPWTADIPSTVSYRREGDSVLPVHEIEPGSVSTGIQSFQTGTIEAASCVAEWIVGMGFSTETLGPEIQARARKLWSHPPTGVADIWFESDHDDTFGAMNEVGFSKPRPDRTWYQGELRDHIKAGESSSGWPAGYRAWSPVRGIIELAGVWSEAGRQ